MDNKKIRLDECIVTTNTVNGDVVMAKNRDRTYKPSLQIVRNYKDGVEYVYLEDIDTNWSEGMNSEGIGIVNSTLNVGFDENERVIVRKKGRKSKDGGIIRLALTKKDINTATKVLIKNMLIGHSLISNTDTLYTLEIAAGNKPVVKKSDVDKLTVRTNHGILIPGAGYTEGENFKSTQIRKISAEKVLKDVEDYNDIAKKLRKDFHDTNSMLNMTRKTDYIFTTSQLVMNLTKKIFILYLLDEHYDQFLGIINNCPKDYKTKINIYVYKIKQISKKIDSEVTK